jgi:DNA-binding beta-propeller fold protein YncE
VSTIDVKTRTKDPNDIAVGAQPAGVAVTPDAKSVFVARMTSRSARSPAGWRSRRVAGDGQPDGSSRRVLIGCGTTRRLSRVLWWGISADPCPGS